MRVCFAFWRYVPVAGLLWAAWACDSGAVKKRIPPGSSGEAGAAGVAGASVELSEAGDSVIEAGDAGGQPAGSGASGASGIGGNAGNQTGQLTTEDCAALLATVRDFSPYTHPDFAPFVDATDADGAAYAGRTKQRGANPSAKDLGLVSQTLGSDHRPLYAGPASGTQTTYGPTWFADWFNDTDGINASQSYALPATRAQSGAVKFGATPFFPIDGALKAISGAANNDDPSKRLNEGLAHNYAFTIELHFSFLYQGGETISFTGNDDAWAFVDDQLVFDLGGVHATETGTLNLDASAAKLGLKVATLHEFSLFKAQRDVPTSAFALTTSLGFHNCGELP